VNEVLSNATCLTRLLLLCRTIHRAICHRPSYWHRIIVSHKNNLKGIQMTLSHASTHTPFHLIVIWAQHPTFLRLVQDFCRYFNSCGLWSRITRLSIQDNSPWTRHAVSGTALDYSLALVSNPIKNRMRQHRNAKFGSITAHHLTRLEINVPTEAQEVYQLLSRCQSLEHFHWIAPDKYCDRDVEEPSVAMPALTSLHIRHCGLRIMIKAPKLESVVWDVHGTYANADLLQWEETVGLQQNLANVRALTVCRCTFPFLHDAIRKSPKLETFTLCPSDDPDQSSFYDLITILREAHKYLRLVTIPVSASLVFGGFPPQRICELITLRPDVRIVCYIMDDFKNDMHRRNFDYVHSRHPSQFTMVAGLDRKEVYRRLGCDLCPNHPHIGQLSPDATS
jgi:hypothetical protein